MLPGEEVYLVAFWDLRTEARAGDATIGHIPWSRAMEYARDFLGFEAEWLPRFWTITKLLDRTYHDWMRSEHARHSRVNRKNAKNGARGRQRVRRGEATEAEAEA